MGKPRQHRTLIFGINFRATTVALTLTIVLAFTAIVVSTAQAQTYKVIHNFTGGLDGAIPSAGLTIDGAGNLYGTASAGGNCSQGYGCGTVFKLSKKGPGFVFNPLYSFQGHADGSDPIAGVVFGRLSTVRPISRPSDSDRLQQPARVRSACGQKRCLPGTCNSQAMAIWFSIKRAIFTVRR